MKETWYSKSPDAEFCIVNTASGYVAYWRSYLLAEGKWREYGTYQSYAAARRNLGKVGCAGSMKKVERLPWESVA
ncbi:hypothetical protein BPGQ101_01160 [Bacillus altitudinis]|uniref:hypothetical protein n=1 Tax=Bacillus altitudinis TaxID=293387 RepID=UPI0010FF97A5|nr:hypothetical protein [Bacillus altitudinis]QCU17544.1 hypothetical protein BPGQ101_01160 [Bacillus altitudinis]